MPINRETFIQEGYKKSTEWKVVSTHANDLFDYLSLPQVSKEIGELNQPGVKSSKI